MAAEQPESHQLSTTSQLSATSSNGILQAKLARRKLQQDVELLSNRVERLRQEERKAKQKVVETRLRGQEISALQKRNEQASTAKALAKRMEEDQRTREIQQARTTRFTSAPACAAHARAGCARPASGPCSPPTAR